MNMSKDNRGGLGNIVLIEAEGAEILLGESGKYYVSFEGERVVIPVYLNKDFSFQETEELTEQGEMYSPVIAGTIPSQYVVREGLERKGWIAIHMDNREVALISGTPEVPLTLTIVRKSGNDIKDINAVSFELKATEAEPSLPMDLSVFKGYI